MATIKVELSATINQGDYNSIKIDVGFEDSVRDRETTENAFSRIYEFVETKLQEKIDDLDNSKPKKQTRTIRTIKKTKGKK